MAQGSKGWQRAAKGDKGQQTKAKGGKQRQRLEKNGKGLQMAEKGAKGGKGSQRVASVTRKKMLKWNYFNRWQSLVLRHGFGTGDD